MKNLTELAILRLRDYELMVGGDKRSPTGLIPLEKAEEIIQWLEVQLLNDFDKKLLEDESKFNQTPLY